MLRNFTFPHIFTNFWPADTCTYTLRSSGLGWRTRVQTPQRFNLRLFRPFGSALGVRTEDFMSEKAPLSILVPSWVVRRGVIGQACDEKHGATPPRCCPPVNKGKKEKGQEQSRGRAVPIPAISAPSTFAEFAPARPASLTPSPREFWVSN